jgi:L-2-hydroxyglutarate oxidase LhgO
MKTEKADVVVIGGGVFGCAIAYYYTRNHPGKKIIVLERNELCNAATSRAAALMTRIRPRKAFIPLALETYHAVAAMEKQLQESMDVKTVGVLHVAAEENSVNDLASPQDRLLYCCPMHKPMHGRKDKACCLVSERRNHLVFPRKKYLPTFKDFLLARIRA